MIDVWSSMNPALTPAPGGYRVIGGTVNRIRWGGKAVGVQTVFPPETRLESIRWMKPTPKGLAPTVVKVKGSTGKVYLVERGASGKWSCTCPGFTYRRFCKHTENR